MVSDSLEWAHRFNSHHIRIPICSNFSLPQTRTGQNTEHGNVAIRTKRFSIPQNSFTTYFRSSFTFVCCGAISWEPKSQTSLYLIIGQGELSCHTSNPPGSIKGRNLSCSGLNFFPLPFWSTQNLDKFVVTLFCDWPMTAPIISMYCIFAESKRRKSKIWGHRLIQIYIRGGKKNVFCF